MFGPTPPASVSIPNPPARASNCTGKVCGPDGCGSACGSQTAAWGLESGGGGGLLVESGKPGHHELIPRKYVVKIPFRDPMERPVRFRQTVFLLRRIEMHFFADEFQGGVSPNFRNACDFLTLFCITGFFFEKITQQSVALKIVRKK